MKGSPGVPNHTPKMQLMISQDLSQKILAGKVNSVFLYPDTDSGKAPGPDFDTALGQLLATLREIVPSLQVSGNGGTESYSVDFTKIEVARRPQLIATFETSEVSIEDVDHAVRLFQ